jgi:hypothetical protein
LEQDDIFLPFATLLLDCCLPNLGGGSFQTLNLDLNIGVSPPEKKYKFLVVDGCGTFNQSGDWSVGWFSLLFQISCSMNHALFSLLFGCSLSNPNEYLGLYEKNNISGIP